MCIDGEDYILEVVEDVTDSLIMDGSQLEQVERITSSYNHLLVTDPLIIARGLSGEEFRSDIESSYQRMRKACIYTRDIEIPFQVSSGIASSEEMSANWEWDDLLALAGQTALRR